MRERSPLLLVGIGLLAGILLMALVGSGAGSFKNQIQDLFGYGGPHTDNPDHGRDLFHSGAPIGGTKDGLTYASFDSHRDAVAMEGFQGFGCVETCGEQEQGYRWAANKRVADVSDCTGASWAFLEGCAAFATQGRGRERN